MMVYLLKVSVVTGIFYLCYKGLLQRETFFEKNRWFLLLGLFTAFVIPFMVIPNYVEIPAVDITSVMNQNGVNPLPDEPKPYTISDGIIILYFIGVLIFFIRFLFQLISLGRLIFTNKKRHLGRITLIETTRNVAPFSFFKWIVYNPKEFSNEELEQIIIHEKVHAAQKHSLDILIGQLSLMVLWFNPFIWLYNKALKQNLEFIADQTAIRKSSCKKIYQYTLLKTSFPKYQFALSNPFYNSLIKNRIIMLQQSKSKKINQFKFALVIPVLGLFLMSFNTKTIYLEKERAHKPVNHSKRTLEKEATQTPLNTYEIIPSKSEPKKAQERVNYIITKNTSDAEFDAFIADANNKGITLRFNGLKRNAEGDIIAIKIDAKSKDSNANYNYNSDSAIDVIKISFDENGKSISIGNAAMKYKVSQVKATKSSAYTITNTDDDEQKIVIRNVETSEDKQEAISVVSSGKQKLINKNKNKNDNDNEAETIITVEDDSPENVVIGKVKKEENDNWTVTSSGKEPLYVLDGKVADKSEIQLLMPEDIEKINVLKGDSAIQKYGEKAKNGVVEITTKTQN